MEFIVMVLVGFIGGGVSVFYGLDHKRRQLSLQKKAQDEQVGRFQEAAKELDFREIQLQREISEKNSDIEAMRQRTIELLKNRKEKLELEMSKRQAEFDLRQDAAVDALRKRQEHLEQQSALSQSQLEERSENAMRALKVQKDEFDSEATQFKQLQREFNERIIEYKELQDENALLKRDLRKLNVSLGKLRLDTLMERKRQEEVVQKVDELGSRYLKENVKWIGNSLNQNNFASCKQRLLTVIERCRDIGFGITKEQEEAYVADLRVEYEKEVRAAFEREEQARIRAQIREEQKREKEIQRELERVARERSVLQAALAKALAETQDQHSAEIESLKMRLAEAEANERAISQAQLTKAGYVYVISNIGSFGEGVFKIGMTRRLEPLERVKELGDASVPFPFDIHMMMSCENAPALENALHRNLLRQQINKTNPRKEFFKTDVESIVKIVREHHGEVQYVADAEALQYRQSLTMPDEDQEFIAHVFDEVEGEDDLIDDDASKPVLPAK